MKILEERLVCAISNVERSVNSVGWIITLEQNCVWHFHQDVAEKLRPKMHYICEMRVAYQRSGGGRVSDDVVWLLLKQAVRYGIPDHAR